MGADALRRIRVPLTHGPGSCGVSRNAVAPCSGRGLLLLLVLILLVALEIAGLMGDGVVTSVVIHVR